MDRPALQRLLGEIQAGEGADRQCLQGRQADTAARWLAKIVDVFDAWRLVRLDNAAFNTTTSAGRITRTMLLSFAQFERHADTARCADQYMGSSRLTTPQYTC